MKKFLALFLILFLSIIAACEKVVEKGSSLTPAELEYLRAKSRNKCLNESNKDYEEFIADSSSELMQYTRDEAWKYEFTKDGTVINTKNIVVWKVDDVLSAVYFLVRVVTDSGTTLSKFYKVTPTINSEMFRDVQYKKCNQEPELTFTFSTSSISVSRDNPTEREDAETQTDTLLTYNYKSNLPALFGFLANKRTVKTLNNDGDVTVTNTWDSVITEIAKLPAQSTNLADYSNKRFCVLIYTPAAAGVPATYSNPYSENCVEDINTALDANGDAVPDFTPATELVI